MAHRAMVGDKGHTGADEFFECAGRNEMVLQAIELSAPEGKTAWQVILTGIWYLE